MEPSEAEKYLPLVARLISGTGSLDASQDQEITISANGAIMASAAISLGESPSEGYTAIIPITGPILKYSAACGPRGMDYYSMLLNEAANNPNINSILLAIDSGGGQTYGIETFTAQLKAIQKPSLAIICDGVGASAAYWIASAASEGIWATTKTSIIGSIGTMITIADMKDKLAKDGIKLHEIYATDSVNKNRDVKEAMKGNYKPIRSELLDPINENFIASIREARGEKLSDEQALTGQIYMAEKAMEIGLIDHIGSVQEAVDHLQSLVQSKKDRKYQMRNQNQTNNSSTMKFKHTMTAILAALGFASVASEEEAPLVSEERLEQLNSSLTAANSRVSDLEGQVSQLQTDLQNSKDALVKAEQERDNFKAQAEKFGKQAGAAHTAPKKDKPEGGASELTPEEQAQAAIDALPHNQALANNPLFNN